jgi:hypothetical protein
MEVQGRPTLWKYTSHILKNGPRVFLDVSGTNNGVIMLKTIVCLAEKF